MSRPWRDWLRELADPPWKRSRELAAWVTGKRAGPSEPHGTIVIHRYAVKYGGTPHHERQLELARHNRVPYRVASIRIVRD